MGKSTFDYDVIVIGAGIQGVGVAQAAAARGWRTLILEQYNAPALGTSSKSSKLIHGGLRYLESAQFKLVYECLKEQKILLKNAPSLVKPASFLIPVYKQSQRHSIWIALGLSLYSILSGKFLSGFCRLNSKTWQNNDKVTTKDLKSVFEYWDAQTDDQRLTEAVLKSAQSLGVECHFDQAVNEIIFENNQFSVATIQGEKYTSRALVNAGGPWVNHIAEHIHPSIEKPAIDLVRGTHIVLDIPAVSCCYYLESPKDGRAFFVLPWNANTMVGTTEEAHHDMPENCAPTQKEIDYLVDNFLTFFPHHQNSSLKIKEQFAGLRVLPSGKSNFNQRNRDTHLDAQTTHPGYIAIYGGKLTSYRAVADRVAKSLEAILGKPRKYINTENLKLD